MALPFAYAPCLPNDDLGSDASGPLQQVRHYVEDFESVAFFSYHPPLGAEGCGIKI